MTEFLLSAPVCFALGFAMCWFFKDPLLKSFLGAKAFAAKLEAKAKAIKAAL